MGHARLILWVFSVVMLAGFGSLYAVETVEAEPLCAPPAYVWLEPVGYGTGSVIISVRAQGSQPAADALPLVCSLHDEASIANARLRVDILDAAEEIILSETRKVSIGEEPSAFTFRWCAADVAPGTYVARFSVLRWRGTEVARRDYLIHKVVPDTLRTDLAAAESALTALSDKLNDPTAIVSSYARVRAQIATDSGTRAREALAVNDWPTAARLIRYMDQTAQRVAAHLALGAAVPELNVPICQSPLADLRIQNGGLCAAGQPQFLLGRYYGHEWPVDIRLNAYGLQLAGLAVGPKDTLAGPEQTAGFKPYLDRVFEEATTENSAVMVSLAPEAMPQWALEASPQIFMQGAIDITQPAAKDVIQRHFAEAVPYLTEKKMLQGMCVAYRPELRFTSEDARKEFLATVERRYGDGQTLNRAWRGLFGSFDEVAIGWDRDNPLYINTARYMDTPAYRFDWVTFHQELATRYLNWLGGLAIQYAPDEPLFVALGGDIMASERSEMGFDLAAMAASSGLSGCSVANSPYDSDFAMGYPQQCMLYTFLRSLAPNKPVVNFGDGVISYGPGDVPPTYDYVRGAMWEAAMAGLNASALDVQDILALPECLDGYATASLDLNRLGGVVTAFQNAPAEMAILWSSSSTIFRNGEPHLDSVRYAFEGCSFAGYNVRFITEEQCAAGGLADVKVLVLPDTPALTDAAFAAIKDYVEQGKTLVRTAAIIQFDERGGSRRDIMSNTKDTLLVRGQHDVQAREYLHALDAVMSSGVLTPIPRTVNSHGYPLEGVKSRYVEIDGQGHLYVINLRKEPVVCHLTGDNQSGRDLIGAQDVSFPTQLKPLEPMLVNLGSVMGDDAVCAGE